MEEEFHHGHQFRPPTLDAPPVSYPAAAGAFYGRYRAAAGDVCGRYPAAQGAPYGCYPAAAGDTNGGYPAAPCDPFCRYPATAGDSYGRYLAAPGALYGRYTAAAGDPYGRYLAAPGDPYGRYPATAGDSYGRYLAAPGAPYGHYTAAAGDPYSPYLAAPGARYGRYPAAAGDAYGRYPAALGDPYGRYLAAPGAPYSRYTAAAGDPYSPYLAAPGDPDPYGPYPAAPGDPYGPYPAALGVGSAPVPCFMDERQEASSFQDLSVMVYWIVERIREKEPPTLLEGGCSGEEASPVRLVRQRPTNVRAHKYYIRCTMFPTDGAFRVRGVGVGWIIRRRPSVRSVAADGGYSANSDDGLGAASDIFLVQPRDGGVPPSCLRTLRQVPWSYWMMALRSWLCQGHCISLAARDRIPGSWSWESLMGPPMHQRPDANGKYDGSCVICASATCIHALHRLGFERRYGAGSFPYELDPDLDYMKLACARAEAWTPVVGGGRDPVLKVMNHVGLRTRDVPGWESCVLRFVGSCVYSRIESSELEIATMIRETGPILGALFAGPNYKFTENNYVYRGEIGAVNHMVVCVAYDFVEVQQGVKELHIWILDNHRRKGPYRWILYQAFHKFTCIQVEAMNREELRISVGVPAPSTEAARLLDLPKA